MVTARATHTQAVGYITSARPRPTAVSPSRCEICGAIFGPIERGNATERHGKRSPKSSGEYRDLHACRPGRHALIYDLMEPHRPQVDREVLGFIRSQTFSPRDFMIDAKGVCRLHPELAKTVSGLVVSGVLLHECVGATRPAFVCPIHHRVCRVTASAPANTHQPLAGSR
jgi:hypothetical protein